LPPRRRVIGCPRSGTAGALRLGRALLLLLLLLLLAAAQQQQLDNRALPSADVRRCRRR
jgi:hypothetical protein